MDYSVTFTGSNIPASLYTLQGTLGCGSATHFFDLPNAGGVGSVTSTSNVWRSAHDCATASVSSLGCTLVHLQISGPGISNRTVNFTASSTPLPVKLVSFNAEALKNKVKIMWTTATETDNDHFTVERSTDGSNWATVKMINGAGTSSIMNKYEVYDENPVQGNTYYRLKQTDIDGRSTYSEVRSIKYTGAVNVAVFPVPNAGNTVNFSGIADYKNWMMNVTDASGARVYASTLSAATVNLPATMKPGLYLITLTNAATTESTTLRYVKI